MPTNRKPMLSVLVDEEKRSQFTQLCAKNARSMSWVINSFITHCVEQDTIDSWLEYPSVMADFEGLAELKEMIAELGQELKRIEASTVHIAIGEGDEIVETSHKTLESQPIVKEVCAAIDNSQALKKQQIITQMAQKMGWKLRTNP
jgi:hypothetical protein